MTARWERGLDGGVEPIPEDVDHDLGCIHIAGVLPSVRPWEVANLDPRWRRAAAILLEVKAIQAREQRAEAERARHRSRRR